MLWNQFVDLLGRVKTDIDRRKENDLTPWGRGTPYIPPRVEQPQVVVHRLDPGGETFQRYEVKNVSLEYDHVIITIDSWPI